MQGQLFVVILGVWLTGQSTPQALRIVSKTELVGPLQAPTRGSTAAPAPTALAGGSMPTETVTLTDGERTRVETRIVLPHATTTHIAISSRTGESLTIDAVAKTYTRIPQALPFEIVSENDRISDTNERAKIAGHEAGRINFTFDMRMTAGSTVISSESVSGSLWFTTELSQFASPTAYQRLSLLVGKAAAEHVTRLKAIPMRMEVQRSSMPGLTTRMTVESASVVAIDPQVFAVPSGYREIKPSR